MIQRYNLYPALVGERDARAGRQFGRRHRRDGTGAPANLPPTDASEWTELALLQLQTKDTALAPSCSAWCSSSSCLRRSTKAGRLPLAVILVVPMCLLSAAAGVRRRRAGHQHLHAGRLRGARGPGVQERDPDRRVRQAEGRRRSSTAMKAALEACQLRLRPIVMTSLRLHHRRRAARAGGGGGAEMRRALGTAVFAGMIGVTLFGIFLTPVFFVVVRRITEEWGRRVTARKQESEISL